MLGVTGVAGVVAVVVRLVPVRPSRNRGVDGVSGTAAARGDACFAGDALVGEPSVLLLTEVAFLALVLTEISAARASSNETASGSWFSSLITKLRVVRLARFRGRLASVCCGVS